MIFKYRILLFKMENKKSNICITPTCNKYSSFNIQGLKAIYCGTCRTNEMINVKKKICKVLGCNIQPSYNFKNLPAEYCTTHKLPNMIDIKHTDKCIIPTCTNLASFNHIGIKPQYCFGCKEETMVNVVSRRCEFIGCKTIPTFNTIGNKMGIFCFKHKKDNMLNVQSKKCAFEGCNIQPSFNFENEKKPIFCFAHKKDQMLDIKSKKCGYNGCNTTPIFNFIGTKVGIFCFKHKKDKMLDIKSKKCGYDGCNTTPCFNFIGTKVGLFCFKHKKDKMLDIKSKKCIHKDCNITPHFNYEDKKKPLFCSNHKQEFMIDIINKRCLTPMCYTQIGNKYKGYCLRCFIYLYPEEKVAYNYKTKEKTITTEIKTQFPDITFIEDKIIEDGCSKRRPDLLLDIGTHVIIIEIDENKHSSYDCSCENKRMMEISQDLNHRPLIFIRFNPDGYTNSNGDKITSPWKTNNLGIYQIMKTRETEWNDRIKLLLDKIKYWMENPTDKTIEIDYLFYE